MREDIIRLHFAGHGQRSIATRLNLTEDVVRAVLLRAGIARVKSVTKRAMSTASTADPNRADRLLRRFSWEG